MAAMEGSIWLEESKLSPPGDQGYSKESAKILQQGSRGRGGGISTQNSSPPLEGRLCKDGSFQVFLNNAMLTTGEMKEYITKHLL